MRNQVLMWCETHNDVAWLFSDGSVSCRYDLVIEACELNHELSRASLLQEVESQKGYVASYAQAHNQRTSHEYPQPEITS